MEQSSAQGQTSPTEGGAPPAVRDAAAEIAEGNAYYYERAQPREALAAFERALALAPDSADAWAGKAAVLVDLNQPQEALEAADHALTLEPTCGTAWRLKGDIADDRAQYADALNYYDRALECMPSDSRAWNNKGSTLRSCHQYEEALVCYRRAADLAPSVADVWENITLTCRELGRAEEEAEATEHALRITPQHARNWHGRGEFLGKLGRYEEAFAALDRALSLDPELVEVWNTRGNLYADQGLHEEAIACYDELLAKELDAEGAAIVWCNKGSELSALERPADALECQERALEYTPSFVDAWYWKALHLNDLGRHDEAFAAGERTLALAPEHSGAWNLRGTIFEERGQVDDALICYDAAIAHAMLPHESVAPRRNKCRVLINHDRCAEALSCTDEALAIAPDDDVALIKRGLALLGLKRYEEAEAAFRRAVELNTQDSTAWDGVADAHFQREQYAEAIAAYDRALTLDPEDIYGWYRKGLCYANLNQYAEAVSAYDRVLALAPGDHDALLSKANALFNLKRYEDAIAGYDAVIAHDPQSDFARKWRAEAFARLGRNEEAAAAYADLIALSPDNIPYHVRRAELLGTLGRRDEALPDLLSLLARLRQPESDSADTQRPGALDWCELGLRFKACERLTEARECYEQAKAANSDFTRSYLLIGNLERDDKHFEEAIAEYDRGLAQPPDHNTVWIRNGKSVALMLLHRYEEALEYLDRVLSAEPEYVAALRNRANALYYLERFDEAIAAYDRLLEVSPGDATLAWKTRGGALLQLHRFEEAITSFDHALESDPDNAMIWAAKGTALLALSRYEEASAALERTSGLATASDEDAQRVTAWIRSQLNRVIPDQHITLRDGRTLGYIEVGDSAGMPILYFHGTPGSRLEAQFLGETCQSLGIRLICPDRPGLGLSDYQHHRKLLDWPSDVAHLADALGIERFLVMGVSAGGLYTCACAYALPERVIAAGLVSSGYPFRLRHEFHLVTARNWFSYLVGLSMPWPLFRTLMEFVGRATRGSPEIAARVNQWRHGNATFFSKGEYSLTPTAREIVVEPFRQGGRGYARDSRIALGRWGFSPEEIAVPVYLWHGERDPLATVAGARYLARTIPNCHATFYPGEKHDVINTHEREIFETLATAGRAALG